MSESSLPEALPKSYRELWKALYSLDRRAGSRQRMSSLLKVSTHTIQRILVDGNVPDIGGTASRRQSLAWARTLVRLAVGLQLDPMQLLEKVGFRIDSEIEELSVSETDKLRQDSSAPADPALILARMLKDIMDSQDSPADGRLTSALSGFIEKYSRASTPRASDDQIADGSFCRSCLARLDENSSSSIYCRWCSNEDGSLKTRQEVLEIMTDWFLSWQPGIDRLEASRRAESYMNAMPAWN